MKSLIATILILGMVGMVVGMGVEADTTGTVTATVTPQLVSVQLDITTVNYGTLAANTESNPQGPITATNNGNVNEKFEVKGSNSTNWTLSDVAAGVDTFMHKFAVDDDSYTTYTALHNTNYKTLSASVSSSGTQLFKLKLTMPTSTSVYTTQSATATVLATAL